MPSKPIRIQRKRTKGWRTPEGAVNVTRPGPWGNPFIVGKLRPGVWNTGETVKDAAEAVRLFRAWLAVDKCKAASIRERLRGKDLMCWCPLTDKNGNPVPCHADVLLNICNDKVMP
jgi:Domain of unknown function (DUF4326)